MSDLEEINNEILHFDEYMKSHGVTDYKNLSATQFEEYFRTNQSSSVLKNLVERVVRNGIRKEIEKCFHVYITGSTGTGKSSYLNYLFGIDLPTSRFGTGTISKIVREVQIAFMKIIITDSEGLGNAQVGNETSMTHNISDIRDQLIGLNNVINILIQAFVFSDNRFKDEEKVQLRNILENIDFTKPEKDYLKIVSKLLIVFLKANEFIGNIEVEEKLYELDEIDSSTVNPEEITKIKNLVEDINNLFQTQFDNQVSKVKSMIRDILKEIASQLDDTKIENIISKINFTYSGKILPDGSVDTIPSKKRLRLSDNMLETNNIKLWNDNWRYNNFNLILANTENTYAFSLEQAIRDRSQINLTSFQDTHSINNADVNNFLRLDHNATRNINDGRNKIIESVVKGAKVAGGTGLGVYGGGLLCGAAAATAPVSVPVSAAIGLFVGTCSAIYNFFS